MIRLSNVKKTYLMGDVEVHALRGVSLTIESSDFVAIMGPSGSGKSTLMNVLGLLDVPDSGSYRLLGQEVSDLTEDLLSAVRSRTLGFVFQQFNLLPRTTALANTALPLLYAQASSAEGQGFGDPGEILKEVGLAERVLHRPNELSGGQQQRVAIARALVNKPRVILADEPTGNLDSQSSNEIMRLLEGLNQRGMTLILVTHEEDIARRARRVIRMKDGRVQSDRRFKALPRAAHPGKERRGLPLKSTANPWHQALKRGWEYFRQARQALMANKLRAGLSVLGIWIGVTAVIAMLAFGNGARISIEAAIASMGSNVLVLRPGARTVGGVTLAWDAVTRLTLEDTEDLAASVPHVKATAPEVWGYVQAVNGAKNGNCYAIGTFASYAAMHSSVPAVGRFFTDDEMHKRAKVAVIGATVLHTLFDETENPIGAFIKINKINFQVVGLMPEKGANAWWDPDNMIFIPATTAMYRVLGRQFVGSVDIEVDSVDNMNSVTQEAKNLLLRRHHLPETQDKAFQVNDQSDVKNAMNSEAEIFTWLLSSLAAISLLVGGIGIMNIMLVSVTERTREIGLRKAVGARRKDILAQFLIESVVVSLTGGTVGIVCGWIIAVVFSYFAQWNAPVTLGAVLLGFLFSVGVGIIFGLWPARKASRLNPIDALRYE